MLLARTKLNTINVFVSKALIDSNISHDKFVSVKNVLKDYDNIKEKRKSFNNK